MTKATVEKVGDRLISFYLSSHNPDCSYFYNAEK